MLRRRNIMTIRAQSSQRGLRPFTIKEKMTSNETHDLFGSPVADNHTAEGIRYAGAKLKLQYLLLEKTCPRSCGKQLKDFSNTL